MIIGSKTPNSTGSYPVRQLVYVSPHFGDQYLLCQIFADALKTVKVEKAQASVGQKET